MNQPLRDLNVIQQWMQAVITHPGGIVSGIESPAARGEIDVSLADVESVILPSLAVSSVERLAIYGNAYFARLLECMRELFPALTDVLSEEVFDSFAFSYLQQYPSRSYTLDRLADHFVEFLEDTRPELDELTACDPHDRDAAPDASWPDFIIDLARLEWTINQVFDGPGVERESPLTPEQLASLPAEQWPSVRLQPAVCLRLLSFRYPVNDFYTSFRGGNDPSLPYPQASYLALTRRDYVVRRFELSRPQFELLSAIVAGQPLGDAIAGCAAPETDIETLAASLQNWFRVWSANGFFQRML